MIFRMINLLSGEPPQMIFAAILGVVGAMLLALCVHEWGHAFAATKAGDPTPKNRGRLTLNPLAHLDPMGTLCLLVAGFGWAKPVPVNPYNFEHPRKGMIWTALAGVITNISMAFISYGLLCVVELFHPAEGILLHIWALFYFFFYFMFSVNIVLFLFNLLPLSPLDGFRLVETFTQPGNRKVAWIRENGIYILLLLILLGFMADRFGLPQLDILGHYYIGWGSAVLSWPITTFWRIFF